MQQTRRQRNPALVLWTLAIAGAIWAIAGCTLVEDRLTGVDLSKRGPTTCIMQCNDLYKTLYAEEQNRHLAEIEACQALSEADRAQCLSAEGDRHGAAKVDLGEAKIECQNGCHRQGHGNAG